MTNLSSRKDDHIALSLSEDVKGTRSAGFEDYTLEHNALPEMDFSEINISTRFLGRDIKMPLIISAMTGGGKLSDKINRALSELANDFRIGLSVGSQRCAFEDKTLQKSFQMVRICAPKIPILANLGASQLNYGYGIDECSRAVDMIDADALTLHLNPLHEVFQSNGCTNFSGLLAKIEHVCKKVCVPVVIKEVGHGISASVAKQLIEAGVYAIEVAGAGSISWTEIEKHRSNDIVVHAAAKSFRDWGIPTAQCIKSISENVRGARIIASGGVDTGVKIAKAIALGASVCGNASEFLRNTMKSRCACENYVETLKLELKATMLCVGCRNISELQNVKIRHINGS